jgi:hypothetical protein
VHSAYISANFERPRRSNRDRAASHTYRYAPQLRVFGLAERAGSAVAVVSG